MIDAKGKEVNPGESTTLSAPLLSDYARLPGRGEASIQMMGALDRVFTKLAYLGVIAVAGLLIWRLVKRERERD